MELKNVKDKKYDQRYINFIKKNHKKILCILHIESLQDDMVSFKSWKNLIRCPSFVCKGFPQHEPLNVEIKQTLWERSFRICIPQQRHRKATKTYLFTGFWVLWPILSKNHVDPMNQISTRFLQHFLVSHLLLTFSNHFL